VSVEMMIAIEIENDMKISDADYIKKTIRP